MRTLEELIGYQVLTNLITTPVGGVQQVWPTEFTTIKAPITGDEAAIPKIGNSRQALPLTNYGGASQQVDQQALSIIRTKCVHSLTHIGFKQEILTRLRSTDERVQTRAQEVIGRQVDEFRRRANNTRWVALDSALRYGAIYVDAKGNILPSSSGAVNTISLNRPAAQADQLGGIIDASWATAGTSILTHLTNIDKKSVENTGRRITRAFYGSDIPKLLRNNTEVGQLLDGNSQLASLLAQNQIPRGFGIPGCVWEPLHTAAFTDKDGTFQYWFPSDYVVFMPEVDVGWYELQEGSYEVPKSIEMKTSAEEAARGFETLNGMFSFCQVEPKPPFGISHYCGDTFLPVFKDWGSVFCADTVF